MNKGTHIKNICVSDKSEECSKDVSKLSIIFARPSLEAKMYSFDNDIASAPYKYVKITLQSGDGAISSVIITSVGQIYVKE